MFGKPRYNKEKGVALCYSSRVVVTKNCREFRISEFYKIESEPFREKDLFHQQNHASRSCRTAQCGAHLRLLQGRQQTGKLQLLYRN